MPVVDLNSPMNVSARLWPRNWLRLRHIVDELDRAGDGRKHSFADAIIYLLDLAGTAGGVKFPKEPTK